MPVQFEEEQQFNSAYDRNVSKSASGLTQWLIKNKIAKDEKSANNVMIIVAIICFALAGFFIFKQ